MDKLKQFLKGILFASVVTTIAFFLGTQALGAPRLFISTPATSTSASSFSFTVGTSTPLSLYGSTTLAIYGSTTIQTSVNTTHAFEVYNAASTSIFVIDTKNSLASTSALNITGLGNTSTNCLQINNQGAVAVSGSGCGGSAENIWTTVSPSAYITPTTTIPMLVNAATSTITNLTSKNATSTFATTTSFGVLEGITVASTASASSTLRNFTFSRGSGTDLVATNGTTTTFVVSGLASALVLTGSGGAFSNYAGTSCTNQFPRSLSALGAATCASVSLTGDITGTLTVSNGGTGATTLNAGGVLIGNGTSAITSTTTSPFTVGTLNATTTGVTATSTFAGHISAVNTQITNLSFTNATSSNSLSIPNSGSLLTGTLGNIGIDTTNGQLRFNAGAVKVLSATSSSAFNTSSTTLNTLYGGFGSAATSTIRRPGFFQAVSITQITCRSDHFTSAAQNAIYQIGSGTATSTQIFCNGNGQTLPITAISIAANGLIYQILGTATGTVPDHVAPRFDYEFDQD